MPRYAARTDKAQQEIVRELRQLGYLVVPTSQVGNGYPDLCVFGYSYRRECEIALLVELKTPGGTLTPAEQRFHEQLPPGCPVMIAHSTYEIIEWFGRF